MPFAGRKHRGIPHFLHDINAELSDTHRAELKAIYTNESLTKQQIRDQVKAFFNKVGGTSAVCYFLFSSTPII